MFNQFKCFFLQLVTSLKSTYITNRPNTRSIKKRFRKVMHTLNIEERFTQIYLINYWNSDESISGHGSTITLTTNLRLELPKLFKQFNIKSVFDGPCGDFNWMKLVVNETEIDYTGADIVLPLIEENQRKYGNESTRFKKLDLTNDILPDADLMICRDCLFHFSYEDARRLLVNFSRANIPYLLTTTYHNEDSFTNKNIDSGHFRMIDLHSAPFHFPKEVLYKIEDWVYPESPRHMCLWSKDQVIEALKKFN